MADDLKAWRQHLHAHPETAFEEVETSAFVAEKLTSFGIEVHRGLAQTGVVGTIKCGTSDRKIGLRADMDALDIDELNEFNHRSIKAGKMHACGHDGHTVMLLGAARYLAEQQSFDGTVYFIFQPAEENEGGGRAMIEDGLFEQFPATAVFGMHNAPGIPVGHFLLKSGPMMAGFDTFDIEVKGVGGHAAMPNASVDPVIVAAEIVLMLQTIASRNLDPMKAVVVSTTQMHGGAAYNVIPESVALAGSVRYFDLDVQDLVRRRIADIASNIAAAHGATVELSYQERYPPTINSKPETDICASVLTNSFGADSVTTEFAALMGSEDFAFMLLEKPGCYILAGNGAEEGSCMVHNPRYDFNDSLTPWGVTYWIDLVHELLPR